MKAVPNIDEDGVKEHIQRHEKYLQLCEEKKTALAEFKELKKLQKQQRVARVEDQN